MCLVLRGKLLSGVACGLNESVRGNWKGKLVQCNVQSVFFLAVFGRCCHCARMVRGWWFLAPK